MEKLVILCVSLICETSKWLTSLLALTQTHSGSDGVARWTTSCLFSLSTESLVPMLIMTLAQDVKLL